MARTEGARAARGHCSIPRAGAGSGILKNRPWGGVTKGISAVCARGGWSEEPFTASMRRIGAVFALVGDHEVVDALDGAERRRIARPQAIDEMRGVGGERSHGAIGEAVAFTERVDVGEELFLGKGLNNRHNAE